MKTFPKPRSSFSKRERLLGDINLLNRAASNLIEKQILILARARSLSESILEDINNKIYDLQDQRDAVEMKMWKGKKRIPGLKY